MQAGLCSKHAEPRAATSCRLDLAHPGTECLRAPGAGRRSSPGRSVVVHFSPRSVSIAASRGLCDRPRRRAGRRSQPGTASVARAAGGTGPDRPRSGSPAGTGSIAQVSAATRLVPGGRPPSGRRTILSRAELGRRGAGRFRPSAGAPDGIAAQAVERPVVVKPTVVMRAVMWYQRAVDGRPSPCRFTPTCSSYALEAFEVHGTGRGLWLTVRRLVRCRPFGPSGWDPVPVPNSTLPSVHLIDETRYMRKRRRA